MALGGDDRERAQTGERVPPPAMVLATVHELRVDAERDVVEEEPVARAPDVDQALGAVVERGERGSRIVAVEPDVAGEVVARPERNADERQVPLDRDRGDRGERAVAARYPDCAGGGRAGDRHRVVAVAQRVRLDAERACGREQLGCAAAAGPRVDDQEARHRAPAPGLAGAERWADRLMRSTGTTVDHRPMDDAAPST